MAQKEKKKERKVLVIIKTSFHLLPPPLFPLHPIISGPDISSNDKRSGFPQGNFDTTKLVNAGQYDDQGGKRVVQREDSYGKTGLGPREDSWKLEWF